MHWSVVAAWFAIAPAGVLGNWTTPDHSVVRIYRCGSEICAQLVGISSTSQETKDVKNPDPQARARPLCDLVIGRGFHLQDPEHAKGGTLYDPESGKTYQGQFEAKGDELKLRGYVGIPLFGRTETWHRVEQVEPCKP